MTHDLQARAIEAVRDLRAMRLEVQRSIVEYKPAQWPRNNGDADNIAALKQRDKSLALAIRALAAQPSEAWRPIESCPTDGEKVLIATRGRHVAAELPIYVHHLIEAAKRDGEACYFTHWQPLPSLPLPPAAPEAK